MNFIMSYYDFRQKRKQSLLSILDKGLVINYGEGGLQNGSAARPKLLASPLKIG